MQVIIGLLLLIIIAVILLFIGKKYRGGIDIDKNKYGDINWDDVKIGKVIGNGMFGIAKLATYNDKKYVYKLTKIMPDDMTLLNKELNFYKFINTLDDNESKYFIKLYGMRIIKCDYKHKLSAADKAFCNMNSNRKKKFKDMNNSKYCVESLIEYGGKTLNESNISNIISDLFTAIDILQRNNYRHGDIHPGNITICDGHIKLIDYGETYKEIDGINYDTLDVLNILTKSGYAWVNYISKNLPLPSLTDYIAFIKSKGKWGEVDKKLRYIYSKSTDKKMINKILDDILQDINIDEIILDHIYILTIVFQALYPKLNSQFWRTHISDFPDIENLVSIKDLTFLIDNFHNIDKLINYFSTDK